MESDRLAGAEPTPPSRWWLRAALAVATTLAAYVGLFTYFLTGCSSEDFGARLQFAATIAVVAIVLQPGYTVAAMLAVAAAVFAASTSSRAREIRNVAIPVCLAIEVVAMVTLGLFRPTTGCSWFQGDM